MRYAQQKGAVLVSSLLLALVMVILALGMSDISVQNEKMIANHRDSTSAFVAANSALVEGEAVIKEITEEPDSCSSAPCTIYSENSLADVTSQTASWWSSNGTAYPGSLDINTAPIYLIKQSFFVADDLSIESIASGQGTFYYEVSAKGTGKTDTAEVRVQSIYSTRYK